MSVSGRVQLVECDSVSGYLTALVSAVAELKWDVNRIKENATSDLELLRAFQQAMVDSLKTPYYSVAAFGLLMTEFKDTDAAYLDPDEL